MSYYGHITEPGDGESRSKKSTTIRAVKNVWYKRALAHVRHYKRFYITFSVILAVAIAVTAVVPPLVLRQHGQSSSSNAPGSTTLLPIEATSILTASTSQSTIAGAATHTIATPAATTAPMTSSTTKQAPTPSVTCAAGGFTANASFVGVYDAAVTPTQFSIVGAHSAGDCCRRCFFGLRQPRRCNGWGWINSMCSIVYDYPGVGADDTCPKGHPLVQISSGDGGADDFAGRGPCALADS
ncbi:hypothetical protein PG994_005268 [Apiospora phragmitis]|uniref:Uncharacterized protein n=1 Tax=Apiospora phragmitis TaxID=2905665 RepID=A0ABR1VSZ1_9PEZI